jgi:general stress protein 26
MAKSEFAPEDAFLSAIALERETGFVTVSTAGDEGFPESRIMFNLKRSDQPALMEGKATALPEPFAGRETDFRTFIATNTSSRKTAQIRADGRVCLYYADTRDFRGLSVMGRLVECGNPDIKRALWREGWEVYYPLGPGDPDFSVFDFTAIRARFYHGLAVWDLYLGGDCPACGPDQA